MAKSIDDLIDDLMEHCNKPKPPREPKKKKRTLKSISKSTTKNELKVSDEPPVEVMEHVNENSPVDSSVDNTLEARDTPTSLVSSSASNATPVDIQSTVVRDTPTSLASSSTNPVQSLNVMNLSPESFEGCRTTHLGEFSVIDAIARFRGISKEKAQDVYNKQVSEFFPTLPKYKFSGRGARETPVAPFKELLQILSRLPGEAAKKLRAEQAEITSRAVAGDKDLEEAIADRRETVDPGLAELAMVGVKRRQASPSVSIPGLYLLEIGRIGEIKADPLALPKRRKDILNLPDDMDDHIQYKFGFSKHLDTRMIQHGDNELKNTSVTRTWSWPVNAGMLTDGESHIRERMQDLGGQLLARTTDWSVMPPKYEDVMGEIIGESVQRYLIDKDPHIQMGISEAVREIEGHSTEMRIELERVRLEAKHQVELARMEAQLKVNNVQHQVEKLQLELEKSKLELHNSDLFHENNRYRYQIINKNY